MVARRKQSQLGLGEVQEAVAAPLPPPVRTQVTPQLCYRVRMPPFAGIGSEGVVALEMGRRFIGAELKESYYKQAVLNLQAAEAFKQTDLFAVSS